MKRIIIIFSIFLSFISLSQAQRWKSERFSLGLIAYTNNINITNDDFGYGISISTRILRFISIETNLQTNTNLLYGKTSLKAYFIPKKYVRKTAFESYNLSKILYGYGNISATTLGEYGIGLSFGLNFNRWRFELRGFNETKNQKICMNPYVEVGFFRSLNFKEYPPIHMSKF